MTEPVEELAAMRANFVVVHDRAHAAALGLLTRARAQGRDRLDGEDQAGFRAHTATMSSANLGIQGIDLLAQALDQLGEHDQDDAL